jgi:uncharacterized protein YegP (UPF0339 family)
MTFQIYKDQAGEWRWRLVHRNGKIMADSGEGYANEGDLRRAIVTIKTLAELAPIEQL